MTVENDPLFDRQWQMDPAVSSFTRGYQPRSESRLYEAIDNGYKLTVSGSLDGQDYEWGYIALYNGEAHPVRGRDDVDSIRIFKLDDRRTIGLFEKALSPGGPYARTVSEDGSQLVVEAAGRRVDGSPFYDVITYRLG
jgi:hypothetical protein